MKKTFACFFLLILGPAVSQGQLTSFKRAFVTAGIAFPAAPDQFYDYWKPGWGATGGLEYDLAPDFGLDVAATYDRFSLDGGRFFKRLKLDGSAYSISGGEGTLVMLSGKVQYFVHGYDWVLPSFFGGLGFLVSTRGAATADYAGLKEATASASSFVIAVPFGFRLDKSWTDKVDVMIDFQYLLGLTKAQDVNSNATSISVGVAIVP